MFMKRTLQLFSLAIIMVATGSCSSSKKTTTEVMSTWKKPGVAAKTFRGIFVTALTNDTSVKQAVEKGIQHQLASRLKVNTSNEVFPPGFETKNKGNHSALLEKIRTTNADGILTIALMDKRTETYHKPGKVTDDPLKLL